MADKNMEAKISVEFNEATSRQSLNSGETTNTLWGKVKRWLSDLKAVAFTGSYNDLENKPEIPTNSDITASGNSVQLDGLQGGVPFSEMVVSGKNLLYYPYAHTTRTSFGVTFTDNGDGSITASGTHDGGAKYSYFGFLPWWDNDTHDRIFIKKGTAITYRVIGLPDNYRITMYAKTGNKNGEQIFNKIAYGENPITYTATEDCYIACGIYGSPNSAGQTVDFTVYPQLEIGSTATAYEPPITGRDLTVNVSGKNLLKYPYNNTTKTVSGITFTDNGDGTITANGTAAQTVFFEISNCNMQPNMILKRGVYTLSGSKSEDEMVYIGLRDINDITIKIGNRYDFGNGVNFNIDTDVYYTVLIKISLGTVCDNLIFRPQLELGDTVTEYEPYHGAEYTITPDSNPYTIPDDIRQQDGVNIISVSAGEMSVTGVRKNAAIEKLYTDLKSVAFSGSYNDLSDTPSIATTETDGLMSAEDKTKLDSADDTYALKSKYGDTTIDVGRVIGSIVGDYSTAEGWSTTASARGSHAEGGMTYAKGVESHAEGNNTQAIANCSHAEGYSTRAEYSHAHAEGRFTIARGCDTHAEGVNTTAHGEGSHAEGISSANIYESIPKFSNSTSIDDIITAWITKPFTLSKGEGSHAEGNNTLALGDYSHTEGHSTRATKTAEHASGQFNLSNDDTLFSIGDGTAHNARHNAFEITTTGGKLHDEEIMTQNNVSNPNLLINPDFGINQRGAVGTYTPETDADGKNVHTYFVDRWGVDSGSVTINSDGTLTLNGTISQILENAVGTNTTASVSAGTAAYDDTTKTFTITGNGDIISWAKLETGSTATPFTPPDPAAELIKCQRYYYRIRNQSSASRQMLAIGYAYSTALMNLILNFPNCMRTPPTVIISDPSLMLYSKTTETSAASMTNVARNGCMIPYNSITLKCTGSFTTNSIYQIFLEKGGYIEFNAEL